MEPEPLPCPFCGKSHTDTVSPDMGEVPAVALHTYPHSTYRVECEACGAAGPLAAKPQAAVSSWNTRANPPVT